MGKPILLKKVNEACKVTVDPEQLLKVLGEGTPEEKREILKKKGYESYFHILKAAEGFEWL